MKSISEIISECKSELNFASARSSGPGGQHVNKTETKVILTWDLDSSNSLTNDQKEIIRKKLSRYINKDGVVTLYDQSTRYQLRNKVKVVAKWTDLLRRALTPVKKRKATKPTRASIEKRMDLKKKLSQKKQHRKKIRFPE